MSDTLERLFAVAAGGGDGATRAALLRDGSGARQLAEEVGRLNAREIDLRRIPGLEAAAERGERPTPADPPPAPTHGGRGAARRRALAAAVVLVLGGGVTALAASLYRTQAAYADAQRRLDRTTAELEDTRRRQLVDPLDTGWLDPTRWRTGRRMTTAVDGYARLNDRGSLVTVREFPGPAEVALEWRWIDVAGDITYRDTLTVALHTSGEHAPAHPFRIRDGIEVAFQSHAGQVSVASPTDGRILCETPEGGLPMPAGKWHAIRIVDDGKAIAVYLSGPAIDKSHGDQPVLKAPLEGTYRKHHVAIYNREPVAGALHESHVRNVSVGTPVREKRD